MPDRPRSVDRSHIDPQLVHSLERLFASFHLDPQRPADWGRLQTIVRPHLGKRKRGRPRGSVGWTADKLLALSAHIHEAQFQGCTTARSIADYISQQAPYKNRAPTIRKLIPRATEVEQQLAIHYSVPGTTVGTAAQLRRLEAIASPWVFDAMLDRYQNRRHELPNAMRHLAQNIAIELQTLMFAESTDLELFPLAREKLRQYTEANIAALREVAADIEAGRIGWGDELPE